MAKTKFRTPMTRKSHHTSKRCDEEVQIFEEDSLESIDLHQRLKDEVEHDFGPARRQTLVLCQKKEGVVVSGLRGFWHWNWFYISHLWVDPKFRSQGRASLLIKKTLEVCKKKKSFGIYVDTFSQDAKKFYVSHQFEIMGTIPNFPKGHARTFLFQRLK